MRIEVVATEEITEDFNGNPEHVHASPGDVGEILFIGPEGHPLVRFHRSGSCVEVELFENAILRQLA